MIHLGALQKALVVKNPHANTGDTRDAGSSLGHEDPQAGEHGNPLWHACLKNHVDRGSWQSMVHGTAKSQTALSY